MAVIPIPANTQFSYNKVVFPVFCKTKVIEKATFSNDKRTIKFSELEISASGFFTQNDVDNYNAAQVPPVAAGMPLDVFMLSIRRKLQVAGRALYYQGRGYGNDLIINDPGNNASIFDVAMGPKPGNFSWEDGSGTPRFGTATSRAGTSRRCSRTTPSTWASTPSSAPSSMPNSKSAPTRAKSKPSSKIPTTASGTTTWAKC
jgi:hypothetical protein